VLAFLPESTRDQKAEGPIPVPPHGAEGAGHICFSSDALDAWAARLVAAGVDIEADFRWPNGARSVYVRDPAGNSIEFAEPKLWETAA
jgi:catechol 2,3-dioxygenase-like lactoylglutathione lyase family enzyme